MKKVTLQDIASSLGISRTTVWKVFSGHGGVSDSLSKEIWAKAEELNYKFPESPLSLKSADTEDACNIAVAVCRPESSMFWMTIIHHIAKELSCYNINLIYTYLPSCIHADYVLPVQLTNGSIQGIIIMNVYDKPLVRLLSALAVPKVFLDIPADIPPESLNGDLILMENRSSISKITEHLIKQGRRHFGFIGDIDYALSNHERYEGFMDTLLLHSITPQPEFMLTGSIGRDTYQEEIRLFLDQLPRMPDAFICVNDYVACILLKLLSDKNYQIPEDIAVSGFDANMESPLATELTTVSVFNADMGIRLASQILYRIHHPQVKYELTYLGSEVIFRSSTRILDYISSKK